MKKLILTLIAGFFFAGIASAQFLPTLSFGVKAGANFSTFPQYGKYTNSSEAGYIAGGWLRLGALGFNFQPELYLTQKDVNISESGTTGVNRAQFTSLDMPLLVGTKVGVFALGARFYTGPVISFAINKNQGFGDDLSQATRLNYQDQNFAWQFGTGLDIKNLSIDLRYEAGINKIGYGPNEYSHTRLNLFNLTLAYSLFSTI
jgi:hypothetical protein